MRGVRGDNSRKGRGPAGSSGLGYRERQCNNAGVGVVEVVRGDSEYLHGSGESDCRRTTTERERLSSNIAIVLNCARMAQRALIVRV